MNGKQNQIAIAMTFFVRPAPRFSRIKVGGLPKTPGENRENYFRFGPGLRAPEHIVPMVTPVLFRTGARRHLPYRTGSGFLPDRPR